MKKPHPRYRRLVTGRQAKPIDEPLTAPCADCPWSRKALPGWLGGSTIHEWLEAAHGESRIDCHTCKGQQCAGAAIYRANVHKVTRSKEHLRLPADPKRCFAAPFEFLIHHSKASLTIKPV